MSETPDPATRPTPVAATPPPRAYEPAKPPRVYVAAAWVVIVAGVLFILATVFFAGAMVVGFSHHCHDRYHHDMMYKPGGPWSPGGGPGQFGEPYSPGMAPPYGPPAGFGPGGPGGPPPSFAPGFGPGGQGGYSQSPVTSPPAPAPNTPGNPRP